MIRTICFVLALLLPSSALAGEEPTGRNWGLADTGPGGAATGDIYLDGTYDIYTDADRNSRLAAFGDDDVRFYTGGHSGGNYNIRMTPAETSMGHPLNMTGESIRNFDDLYQSVAMLSDGVPSPVTVWNSKHPWPGIGGTFVDGAPHCVIPASGANNLTGVTLAATTGDTLTFTTLDYDCEETITVLTEGTHYDCDGAGTDAACVVNIAAAVNGLAAALGLNAAVVVGETTNFYPTVGTVAHLTVVSSDNTNTVIVRGTDGVFKVKSALEVAGTLDVSGTSLFVGIAQFDGNLRLNDADVSIYGTGSDYWEGYSLTNTAYEFTSNTNGTVFSIQDGTDDVVFNGSITVGAYTRHHDFTAGALASVGVGAPDLECCGSFCGQGLDNANELLAKAVEIPAEWDGVSDMTIHIHAVPADSDPVADTEDIDLDFEWRSVDPDTQTGKTGTVATVTSTYLQSGGAGAECEVILFSITIPYTGGNQPLAVGDDLGIKFNRNPGSEANTYSGNIIIYKAELIYSATGIATH